MPRGRPRSELKRVGKGRPRKSHQEKLKEGYYEKRPARSLMAVEVFHPPGAPFVPPHLHDDAQACAEHIISNYTSKGLASVDSYVLSVFCSAWAWHKAAVHEMNAPGFQPVIPGKGRRGPTVNPWFKIMNEQAKIMVLSGGRLFLTPADRHVNALSRSEPESKFEGLIGQQELSSLSSD